jgi:DNA-binding Lrp family transcriptional regulator
LDEKKVELRNIEVRLIVELMKNSRRSDRELAKAIGSSQPTVSRAIKRLEKEGVIKEYTMIPDFVRLGYQIMGITFTRTPTIENKKENVELRKAVEALESKNPYASLMAVNGIGCGKDVMFITLYKNYARYSEAMRLTKSLPYVDPKEIESFLVDLNDENNYRLLTLKQVARNIQASEKALIKESTQKDA